MVSRSESQRRFWYGLSSTPSRSASSIVCRAACASSANGLSQTTGSPRRSNSSVSAVCVAAGVDTVTASTPAATRSSTESYTATPGMIVGYLGSPVRRPGHHAGQRAPGRTGDQWSMEVATPEAVADQPDPHHSVRHGAIVSALSTELGAVPLLRLSQPRAVTRPHLAPTGQG